MIGLNFGINGEDRTKRHPNTESAFIAATLRSGLTDMNTKTAYIEFPESGRSLDVGRRRMETV